LCHNSIGQHHLICLSCQRQWCLYKHFQEEGGGGGSIRLIPIDSMSAVIAAHLQRPPRGLVSDNWMTPEEAWIAINQWLPKDKVISEPFFHNGKSGDVLRKLGCTVVHENLDFFRYNFGDVVVTNPPFSLKKEVFTTLVQRNKPFIMICPANVIHTKYIRELFKGSIHPLKLIIPYRRIYFDRPESLNATERRRPNFDCYYYCWQMGPKEALVWADNDGGAGKNQLKKKKRKRSTHEKRKRKRKKKVRPVPNRKITDFLD
jgi:hypothetical protein